MIKKKFCSGIAICVLLCSLPSLALGQPNRKDQKKTEARDIKAQIEQIDQDIDRVVEKYNQANVKLGQLRTESRIISAKIEKAKRDLEIQKSVLNKRLCNIYKHGDVSFVETVLATKRFDQFLCTLSRLQDITSEDARIVRNIETLRRSIEEKKVKLAEQEKSQQAACRELALQKSEIEKKLDGRKNALAGVEDEIAAIEREEQAEAERLRAQVEAEQRRQQPARGDARSLRVSRGSERLPAPKGGVVGIAMAQLGKPYRWAGAGPDSFDCSGLVMYSYSQVGVSLPHSAAAQYSSGTHVSRNQLEPGDLVFFTHGGGGIDHVGMYVGGDSYIHAPHTGDVVKISSLSARGSGFVGAVRP